MITSVQEQKVIDLPALFSLSFVMRKEFVFQILYKSLGFTGKTSHLSPPLHFMERGTKGVR